MHDTTTGEHHPADYKLPKQQRLVLPVIIPVIALAGQLTSLALTQPMTTEWALVIVLLLGYDLITVLGGAAAFSLITELY